MNTNCIPSTFVKLVAWVLIVVPVISCTVGGTFVGRAEQSESARGILQQMRASRKDYDSFSFVMYYEAHVSDTDKGSFAKKYTGTVKVRLDGEGGRLETIEEEYRNSENEPATQQLYAFYHDLWADKRRIRYKKQESPPLPPEARVFDANAPTLDELGRRAGSVLLKGCYRTDTPVYDILLSGGQAHLRDRPEQVDGFNCRVVEAHGDHGDYTVWVDVEHGYNIRKAVVHKETGDFVGVPGERLSSLASLDITLDQVVIESVDGRYVPIEGRYREVANYIGGGRVRTREWTMKISEFQFAPDFEAMGAFKIVMNDAGQLIPYDRAQLLGAHAPEIDIEDWVQGENTSLADLKGKLIVLALWAAAHEGSADVIETLNTLATRHADVAVIAVHSSDADTDVLKQFISDKSIKFRVAVDKPAESYRGATFQKYGVRQVPAVYIIDAEGKVRYQDILLEAVEEAVKQLLDEQ